jgi:hypothetical protein
MIFGDYSSLAFLLCKLQAKGMGIYPANAAHRTRGALIKAGIVPIADALSQVIAARNCN